MKARYYLWVWEDAFRDYTAGLGVAVAPTAEEARRQLLTRIGYAHPDLAKEPQKVRLDRRSAFFVHGGG